jgi:hypothetical protein
MKNKQIVELNNVLASLQGDSYMIYDWADNLISKKTFKTFESAWHYILGDLTERLKLAEDDYQEYFVEKRGQKLQSRLSRR